MPVIYVRDPESGQFTPIPTLKGDKGEKGDSGKAATVSLGSFSTGEAGSEVVITNTGTSESAVFNFTIPRGDQGLQGNEGKAATIEVGTVTTGEAGSNATVTNAGTTNAARFNFVIPRGDKGEAGLDGNDGKAATIKLGTVTTGKPGTSVQITNSGSENAATFNFTIPRGETGLKGDKGDSGEAATIQIGSVTTGNAGTQATITNSGTNNAAVLNFTIPKGADGINGTNGKDGVAASIQVGTVTTGAAGTNASVTNAGTPNAAKLNFTIPRGEVGAKGDDGYTPKKGTDYWTETDRQSIVSEVLNNTSHRYVTKTISLTSWQTVSENVFTSSFTDTKIPADCKLDIAFDTQDILQLISDGVSSIRADNDNGTVQIVCIGAKPTTNLNAQISFVKIVQA